jgi:hypothetical protein
MKTFLELGTVIGELVERKNAAYGSSFAAAGKFLAILYPDGLQSAQYDDALLLVRIFDKQMRIATDRDALGESPYLDISGYGILGAHLHQQRKASEPCRSVSGPDVTSSSIPTQSDTAEPNTSAPPSPIASGKVEQNISPNCGASLESTTSASIQGATEVASPSAGGLSGRCARCDGRLLPSIPMWFWKTRPEPFCSETCAIAWGADL